LSDTIYEFGRNTQSDQLVEVYHYSHYIPANIQFCATEIRDNEPVAACFFSIPATRWAESVLELCRLVRKEEVDPKPVLTTLISQAVKQINREKKFNLLVSFADSTQGHHGGIYQACSWNFHTLRKARLDGFIIKCTPHYDTGKYLYWRSLDKYGEQKAERLGLQKQPYRKPNVIL
jgi:hypothetical protein